MEKTKVTHSSQRVRYLGYDIFVSRSKDTKRSKNGTLRRAWYGTVNLRMPHENGSPNFRNTKPSSLRMTSMAKSSGEPCRGVLL